MDDILNEYITYLEKELNYSSYTTESYKQIINDYHLYLKQHNSALDIDKKTLFNYQTLLSKLNYSINTINKYLSTIRSYYDYLVSKNYLKNNIFKQISNPKKEKLLPNFLTYEELNKIFDFIEPKDFLSTRNRLIIELLYATGIRVGELVKIKVNDIDFHNKTIKVMGKGSKERIVYYGSYCKEILDLYINNYDIKDYLIVNNKYQKITVRGIEYILDKIIKDVGIKSHVSPHTIRHTFATHMLNNGADIRSVQMLLGHSSLSTTGIYTHVTNEELRKVYLHTHPKEIKNKDK